jgi:hypothetical protein
VRFLQYRSIDYTAHSRTYGDEQQNRDRSVNCCDFFFCSAEREQTKFFYFTITIDVARTSFAGNFSQPMSEFVAQKIFCDGASFTAL